MEIRRTEVFIDWFRGLRDRAAQARIAQRLARFKRGLLGDVKPVGDGVSEARVDHGPGYRIYFVQDGATLVVLLCGGDKASQARDIARAKVMAREWRG